MIFLLFLATACLSTDISNSTEILTGLKVGLQKNGQPGACLLSYPNLVKSVETFKSALFTDFHSQLQATSQVSNSFTQFVAVCNFQNLADKFFGIYQWNVLQPILLILASNLTLFIELVNLLMLAIQNGFYYNIGLYAGKLIQLVFTFSI